MPRNPDYYQKQSDCSAHTIVTAAENVKLQMLLNRLIDIIAEDPTVEELLINKVAPVVEEVKTTLTDTVLPTINEQVLPVVEEVKKNIEPLVTEVATEVLPTVQQNLDAESKIREDHDKQLGTAIKNLNRVIGTEHLGEQSIVDIITLLKTKDQELLSDIKNCTTTADQKIIDSVQDARIEGETSRATEAEKLLRADLTAAIETETVDRIAQISEVESKLGTALSDNFTTLSTKDSELREDINLNADLIYNEGVRAQTKENELAREINEHAARIDSLYQNSEIDTKFEEVNKAIFDEASRIKAIEDDYLTAEDKYDDAEIRNLITAEVTRATEIEGSLRSDVDLITSDYLKVADIANFETKENVKKVADDFAAYKETADVAIADRYTKGAADAKFAIKGEDAYDDTEVRNLISAETQRAEGIESGIRADVNTIKADYLKTIDKDELQDNIDTINAAVERLTNGASAEEVDSVNDLIQYVKEHGAEVTGIKSDIKANTDAIAAINNHNHIFNEAELNLIQEGDVAKWNAEIGAKALAETKTTVAKVKEQIEAYNYATEADLTTAEGRIKAIEDDYLKAVDRYDDTTLKADLAGKADKTYLESELAKYTLTTDQQIIDGAQNTEIAAVREIAEAAAIKTAVETALAGKVDKVEGKSLISDSEIARLASVANYDDASVKADIAKKADTATMTTELDKKVDKVAGYSLIADTEIERLANVNNYDDSAVHDLITTEAERAEDAESALRNDVDVIKADYLKEKDKYNDSEVRELISSKADKTYVDDEVAKKVNIIDYSADKDTFALADDVTAISQELSTHTATAANEISTNKTNIANLTSSFNAHVSKTEATVESNTAAINILTGTGEGSVDKKITDAFNDFAAKMSDDSTVNTYKELIDYAATHGAEFTALSGNVSANTNNISTNSADIEQLRQDITNMLTEIATLTRKVAQMEGAALCITNGDEEVVIPTEDLERYFAYGDSATVRAKAAEDITDRILAHLQAKFISGPSAGSVVQLVKLGEDENGNGIIYEISNIIGKCSLEGVWVDAQWTPTWSATSKGTLQSGATDIVVNYGTGISVADMPYAIGNGSETGTDTFYKFNGWSVSGTQITDSGSATFSGRSDIPATATSATATAQYTTMSNVRNRASKLNELKTVTVSASNSAVQLRISDYNGNALESDGYVSKGVFNQGGYGNGYGFTKIDKGISEKWVWNAIMIPVVFDGEIAQGLKTGKFTVSDLRITVSAQLNAGATIPSSNGSKGRTSMWLSASPAFDNLGSAFTWSQSAADTSGTITTTFAPFNGTSTGKYNGTLGGTSAVTIFTDDGSSASATRELTISGSSSDGFKIGICCAFYTEDTGLNFTTRKRCNHYATVNNITYTVSLAQ